jgi:putative transposase
MAESWFGTIKVELLYRRIWRTRHEAQMEIFRWIEGWYNPRRIQESLGWRSPLEYEAATFGAALVSFGRAPVVGVRSFTEMRRNRAR